MSMSMSMCPPRSDEATAFSHRALPEQSEAAPNRTGTQRAHLHERARTPRMPKKTENIPKQSMGNALGKRPTGVVANRASK